MRLTPKLFVGLMLVLGAAAAHAEGDTAATGWKNTLVTDLTVTQTSYSNSWVGGEAGSINWVWNLDGSSEKQLSPKLNFKSTLRLKFGQTLTQVFERDSTTGVVTSKPWKKPQKSTDLIDWENVARYTLGGSVDPYTALRLESQFFDGRVEARKLFFSPLKLTESAGLAHQFHKKDNESVISRMGFAVRQTITTGIIDSLYNTKKTTSNDGGLESVSDATLQLSERIQWVGKLSLYKALFSSESDNQDIPLERRDYWKATEANFESTLTAAVSKLISVSLYAQLLYDKEIDKRARFKETLALGFVYRLK